jgi:integrase
MSDFKAALNLAHKRLRKSLPSDFGESVRFGLGRDEATQYGSNNAREDQILPDETVRDIIDASASFDDDGDVGRMVLVLAATGARFSQVQRIRVGDVQSDRLRIFVPTSRKGRGKTEGHYPVQVGEDVIDRLGPAMASRRKDEPLLCRWRLVQVKASEWRKDRRGPWASASEMTRQWKAICESLKLGSYIVPYALRHSSIVRGIRSGLPIRLVAAMHDTSVAMIERHYARYIVDGLEDLAAKAVVTLVRPKVRAAA